MSPSLFQYEHIEGVERLEHYRPGGYHPIEIGDYLHKRYRVVHKLGYGIFSTTWLARDERLSQYVAIKTGTADSDRKEVDILSRLNDPAFHKEACGRVLLLPVLDHFNILGPNGTNPYLVTTLARCSLADTKEASNSSIFQLEVARSLAAQFAIAVAYMHDLGYVHGDLHLGNLLLQLPSTLDHLSDKQLYDEFGPPDPEPITRVDGKQFTENCQPKDGRSVWSWDQRFEDSIQEPRRDQGMGEVMGDKERDVFFDMVRWMLAFRPSDRPSAKQVLRSAWMKNWAIPDCKKTWNSKLY